MAVTGRAIAAELADHGAARVDRAATDRAAAVVAVARADRVTAAAVAATAAVPGAGAATEATLVAVTAAARAVVAVVATAAIVAREAAGTAAVPAGATADIGTTTADLADSTETATANRVVATEGAAQETGPINAPRGVLIVPTTDRQTLVIVRSAATTSGLSVAMMIGQPAARVIGQITAAVSGRPTAWMTGPSTVAGSAASGGRMTGPIELGTDRNALATGMVRVSAHTNVPGSAQVMEAGTVGITYPATAPTVVVTGPRGLPSPVLIASVARVVTVPAKVVTAPVRAAARSAGSVPAVTVATAPAAAHLDNGLGDIEGVPRAVGIAMGAERAVTAPARMDEDRARADTSRARMVAAGLPGVAIGSPNAPITLTVRVELGMGSVHSAQSAGSGRIAEIARSAASAEMGTGNGEIANAEMIGAAGAPTAKTDRTGVKVEIPTIGAPTEVVSRRANIAASEHQENTAPHPYLLMRMSNFDNCRKKLDKIYAA